MAVSVAIRGGRRGGGRPALAVLLLLLALALLGATPSPAPAASGRALVVFAPADPRGADDLLELLSRKGFAVGLTSPTVGGYSPEQMLLDMSQGARLSGAAYGDTLDPLDLRRTGNGGRIAGWRSAVERARDATGTVVPGLLAGTIERAGGDAAYAGVSTVVERLPPAERIGRGLREAVTPVEPEPEAIVAADRAGRVGRVSLGDPGTLVDRTLRLLGRSELTVVRLPFAERGRRALDELLDRVGGRTLVYVSQAPPPEMELLPTGVRGPGFSGLLTSPTTRGEGLVAAPDLAPTVLETLGLEIPGAMQESELESAPGSVGDLVGLERRLEEIIPRREAALTWLLFAGLALIGGMGLAAGRRGVRAGLRIGFLGALWLPAIALVTAALRPSEAIEIALLVGGGVALGALTDRLLPWPGAPLAPAAAVFAGHAIDLAAGSPLIAVSLAGPNPAGGARFFGIGNELEIILALTALLGAAAALALAPRARPRLLPWAFAGCCAVAALILGAGQLGAAVGGVITLAAGGAAAVLASLPGRPSRRGLALAAVAPVSGLACLAAIDIATAGGAHFTREVLQGDDPGELLDTVHRRLDLSASGLEQRGKAIAVAVAAGLLLTGVALRDRLLAPLERAGPLAARAVRAGLAGALAATAVGALVNDSGPTILLIGTLILALAVGYVGAPPPAHGPASTTLSRCA